MLVKVSLNKPNLYDITGEIYVRRWDSKQPLLLPTGVFHTQPKKRSTHPQGLVTQRTNNTDARNLKKQVLNKRPRSKPLLRKRTKISNCLEATPRGKYWWGRQKNNNRSEAIKKAKARWGMRATLWRTYGRWPPRSTRQISAHDLVDVGKPRSTEAVSAKQLTSRDSQST